MFSLFAYGVSYGQACSDHKPSTSNYQRKPKKKVELETNSAKAPPISSKISIQDAETY